MRSAGLFFALFLLLPTSLRAGQLNEEKLTLIERLTDRSITTLMQDKGLPGVGFALAGKDGIIITREYGYADVKNKRYIVPDTLFRVASLTKLITSNMILSRVDSGQLDLDIPISRYLPDTANQSNASALSGITLRQLLTHRSGLPRTNKEMRKSLPSYNYPGTCERVLREIGGFKTTRKPGSKYVYSNLGYSILGMVLENLENTQFDQLIDRDVFSPLKMYESAIVVDNVTRGRFAQTYGRNGKPVALHHWSADCFSPAGGVVSTVTDLGSFLASHMKASRGKPDAHLTWRKDKLPLGTIYSHGGRLNGFRSYIGYSPEHELGIVLWTNRDISIAKGAKALLMEIIRALGPTADSLSWNRPQQGIYRHQATLGVNH